MWTFLRATLLMGIGATALIDLWALALNRVFGLPLSNWAFGGRWFLHLFRGTVFHPAIAEAEPIRHEHAIGWLFHYAVGIAYAAIFLLLVPGWLGNPTFLPAWLFGLATVLAGWLLYQPGLGLGIAASRRPNAWQIRGLNLVSHTVFGFGLWAVALLLR